MNSRIVSAKPKQNYQLLVTFVNKETGIFDCTKYLGIGVFKELSDPHYFSQLKVVAGTVTWPHEQDFCPDTVYLESVKQPCEEKKFATDTHR